MFLSPMADSKPTAEVSLLPVQINWQRQFERLQRTCSRLGLFTRTFLLLVALMLASLAAWLLVFITIETGPRAAQLTKRIATSVNLTQAALRYTPIHERPAMLRELSRSEGLDVYPRSNTDVVEPLPNEAYWQSFALRLRNTLGEETRLAWTVNDVPGVWVGFRIDHEPYWLSFDRHEIGLTVRLEWLSWGAAALLLSIVGAAVGVSYINRPLSRLARSAHLLSRGESPAPLPETGARELRALNASFNRMARELEQTDTDRALMLAGISHDLSTTLTRMRLEIELSNIDVEALFGIVH
jgi:two-component system osmolarity sensor histidine kinase EnvZ